MNDDAYRTSPDPKRQLAEILGKRLPDAPKSTPKKPAYVAGQMNATESEYAAQLLARKQSGEILGFIFEPLILILAPATTYKPDFLVLMPDGSYEFHEVKGGYCWEDARIKIKVAAAMFSAKFVLAQKRKGAWKIKQLPKK